MHRTHLVVVDLRLRARCWDSGCREVTGRQSAAESGQSPGDHGAEHGACSRHGASVKQAESGRSRPRLTEEETELSSTRGRGHPADVT